MDLRPPSSVSFTPEPCMASVLSPAPEAQRKSQVLAPLTNASTHPRRHFLTPVGSGRYPLEVKRGSNTRVHITALGELCQLAEPQFPGWEMKNHTSFPMCL